MAEETSQRHYRFGVFEVDRATGELKRAGARVRLQGKPFDLLVTLLEARGDLVTRETLHERLWPGTIVDFEGSLNAAMKRLRDALRDSADAPRYIETLPRHGYRMLVPVEVIGAPGEARGGAAGAGLGEASAASQSASGADPRGAGATPALPIGSAAPRRPHRFLAGVAIGMAIVAAVALVSAVVTSGRRAAETPVKHKLLVLPFENLSADPGQAFFSDGLTEEMITQLGRLSPDQLGVIARTTAMQYRGAADVIGGARRDHGVDFVLEGAVRREGSRVRVSAKLIRAAEETQVWAASFDRDMKEVLALQSDLAREIAAALAIELLPAESRRLAAARPVSPQAFEATLRGRHHLGQQTGEGFRNAGAAFRQALEADPGYAPAWTGLAETWAMVGIYDFVRPNEAFPNAREAAERALGLDPNLAAAHAVIGLIECAYDWDCQAGEYRLRKAISLDPGDPTARQWLANLLALSGRVDEAAVMIESARQIDPLSRILLCDIGWHHFHARRYDQAISQLQAVLELDPHFLVAHDNLAWAYFMKGDYPRYIEHSVRALELAGDDPEDLKRYREFFEREGWRALRRRSAIGMAREAEREYVSPYDIALEWAAYGDRDQALRWLSRSIEQREVDLVAIRVDPRLQSLHDDPRFEEIARRIVPRVRS